MELITGDTQFFCSKKKLRFDPSRITQVFTGTYNRRLVFYSSLDRRVYLSNKYDDVTHNMDTYEIESLRGMDIKHIAIGEHFMIVRTSTYG